MLLITFVTDVNALLNTFISKKLITILECAVTLVNRLVTSSSLITAHVNTFPTYFQFDQTIIRF